MRLPIQYAFSYPQRLPLQSEALDLFKVASLHFEEADQNRFPCLRLAYEAIKKGGNMPCVLNAAGEITNLAFREGRIGFMDIPYYIEQTMSSAPFIKEPSLDDLFETDALARDLTCSYIN